MNPINKDLLDKFADLISELSINYSEEADELLISDLVDLIVLSGSSCYVPANIHSSQEIETNYYVENNLKVYDYDEYLGFDAFVNVDEYGSYLTICTSVDSHDNKFEGFVEMEMLRALNFAVESDDFDGAMIDNGRHKVTIPKDMIETIFLRANSIVNPDNNVGLFLEINDLDSIDDVNKKITFYEDEYKESDDIDHFLLDLNLDPIDIEMELSDLIDHFESDDEIAINLDLDIDVYNDLITRVLKVLISAVEKKLFLCVICVKDKYQKYNIESLIEDIRSGYKENLLN